MALFLAGVCLNRLLHRRADLMQHLEFVGRMLFVPFFFVETGMRLELSVLQQAEPWLLALTLTATVIVAKSAAAALATKRFGYSTIAGVAIASLSFPRRPPLQRLAKSRKQPFWTLGS